MALWKADLKQMTFRKYVKLTFLSFIEQNQLKYNMHSALLFLTSTKGPQAEVWKAIKWDYHPDIKQRLLMIFI